MAVAMSVVEPYSLTSKEIQTVDPWIVAEMMQLEFDGDGDGR
jgi:hypothetical protein